MEHGWLIPFFVVLAILIFNFFCKRKRYEGYDNDHSIIRTIKLLLAKMNPDFTRIDMRIASESYTEKKRTIYLCVFDADGNIYDTNTLVYVALHEIAHMMSGLKAVGDEHDDEFTRIFYILLERAEQIGIYDPDKKIPVDYCKKRKSRLPEN